MLAGTATDDEQQADSKKRLREKNGRFKTQAKVKDFEQNSTSIPLLPMTQPRETMPAPLRVGKSDQLSNSVAANLQLTARKIVPEKISELAPLEVVVLPQEEDSLTSTHPYTESDTESTKEELGDIWGPSERSAEDSSDISGVTTPETSSEASSEDESEDTSSSSSSTSLCTSTPSPVIDSPVTVSSSSFDSSEDAGDSSNSVWEPPPKTRRHTLTRSGKKPATSSDLQSKGNEISGSSSAKTRPATGNTRTRRVTRSRKRPTSGSCGKQQVNSRGLSTSNGQSTSEKVTKRKTRNPRNLKTNQQNESVKSMAKSQPCPGAAKTPTQAPSCTDSDSCQAQTTLNILDTAASDPPLTRMAPPVADYDPSDSSSGSDITSRQKSTGTRMINAPKRQRRKKSTVPKRKLVVTTKSGTKLRVEMTRAEYVESLLSSSGTDCLT